MLTSPHWRHPCSRQASTQAHVFSILMCGQLCISERPCNRVTQVHAVHGSNWLNTNDSFFVFDGMQHLLRLHFDRLHFLWVLSRCRARSAATSSAVFWARGKRTQTRSFRSATKRRAFKFFPFLKSHTSSLAGSPTGPSSPAFWEWEEFTHGLHVTSRYCHPGFLVSQCQLWFYFV